MKSTAQKRLELLPTDLGKIDHLRGFAAGMAFMFEQYDLQHINVTNLPKMLRHIEAELTGISKNIRGKGDERH